MKNNRICMIYYNHEPYIKQAGKGVKVLMPGITFKEIDMIQLLLAIISWQFNMTDKIIKYSCYTKCNFKSVQSHSGIMPMNRNVKANRVSEDWTVTFLQSVLKLPVRHSFSKGEPARCSFSEGGS